jgi:thiamine biosynthesis lipoprotein ApbE
MIAIRGLQYCSLASLLLACWPQLAWSKRYSYRLEHILGTSMQWNVEAPNQYFADASRDWALKEIDRLSAILSRYRMDSELNRLSDSIGQSRQVSEELADVLRFAEELRLLSDGGFDLRVSELVELWKQVASATGPQPQGQAQPRQLWTDHRSNFESVVERFKRAPFELDGLQLRVLDWPKQGWTLDAIGKGYILDRLADGALLQFPELAGVLVDIGGDIRIAGIQETLASIENPFHATEGGPAVWSWKQTRPVGIATSGGYRRSTTTGSSQISHILDARTGLPAEQLSSVTVIAPSAMIADGLATAVCVLGLERGMELIESQLDCACFIIDQTGRVHTSANWPAAAQPPMGAHSTSPTTGKPVALNPSGHEKATTIAVERPAGLHVWFELAKPEGTVYRRPYLALWLEDEDGFPVKTSLLWLQTEPPGPRWHRDLTRWYRHDRIRKAAEKKDLLEVISGATRGPGQYEAHFDGTDNEGQPLSPGRYTLFLEVAREHGTYQLIRQTIQWGRQPIARMQIKGNIEVASMALEYLPSQLEEAPKTSEPQETH